MTSGQPAITDDVLEEFWTPPRPVELPAVRAALAEQQLSPIERQHTAMTLAMGKGALVPNGPPDAAAALLLDEEHERLRTADLYYLTPEMTELARVAGEDLPDWHLAPEDMPSRCGFVMFAGAIGAYVSEDSGQPMRSHIVACTWGPSPSFADAVIRQGRQGGVWLTFWAAVNRQRFLRRLIDEAGHNPADAQRILLTRGELSWDNESWMTYGDNDAPTFAGGPTNGTGRWDRSTGVWVQTLRAAWLLMTQPGVTDVDHQRLTRQQQRRAAREGYTTSDVRVVRLRAHPAAHQANDSDGGREYTVRWTVRGHWRRQAHGPQRSLRRPVWIAPHIKGPADAPLAVHERVTLVDRPPAGGRQ